MSTRSVIAKPRGRGVPKPGDKPGFFAKLFGGKPQPEFEGVYHHNGGPPSEMGPILWNLFHARHAGNVETFWRELIDDNPAGWSSLQLFSPPTEEGETNYAVTWDGKTKLTVEESFAYFERDETPPGPASFQNDPKRHIPGIVKPPLVAGRDLMGAELVYVADRDELVVYTVEQDGRTLREGARISWRGPAPDWDALEEKMLEALG